ncbi:MAG: hypothetical protein RL748_2720 [Pseudomonadota bacterium]
MNHQVTAKILFLVDVPAPKLKGVVSGYSPHHKFEDLEYLVSGRHEYADQNTHYPGDTLIARIGFASWEFFGQKIKVGDKFEIRELDRKVGVGTVISIDV